MGKYCFGIDVGGTSVKCGLFQTDGVLVEKWEIPTRKENLSLIHIQMCIRDRVYYANQMESVDKLTERLEGTGIKFEYKKPDAAV